MGIAAPPERVFAHINGLHAMNRWNPFVQQDPDLQGDYSGPSASSSRCGLWTVRPRSPGP
jgi:hypothetical protein